MKYGLIPSNFLERVALWTGKIPTPLLDALYGPIKTRAIMAGASLGIFEALRGDARTPAELATELHLDAGSLELLMRTLVLCDYLVQQDSRFALSAMARRTMLRGSPMELVGYMRFNYEQWGFIAQLETLVRTGRGVDFHKTMTSPESWAAYQRGMLEIARLQAPVIAAYVPVPAGATRLLDIAGSHGLIGAAICRKHPPLRSTIIDLPQALVHARPLAAEEGIGDIVEHREGDLLSADYGREHDVVVLASILHHFVPETILSILARCRQALRSGGTVAIWDVETPAPGSRVTSGDGAALFFRLTSTAGAYHGTQYGAWLESAGFGQIKIVRPMATPGNVLVTART
jgi:2-polyprenyl-3-methyl-5-hydroxy-6-metoxy-1,4-benzoquinol methylase